MPLVQFGAVESTPTLTESFRREENENPGEAVKQNSARATGHAELDEILLVHALAPERRGTDIRGAAENSGFATLPSGFWFPSRQLI